MLGDLAAGLSSLKAAKDIIQGLNAASTQAAITEVQVRLQNHLLDAQQALFTANATQATCVQRVHDLEQEIVQLKDWGSEKERYELKPLGSAAVAYVLKQPERSASTAHAVCTNCFERGFKSILQSNGNRNHLHHAWVCPSCKASFACQSSSMATLLELLDRDGR